MKVVKRSGDGSPRFLKGWVFLSLVGTTQSQPCFPGDQRDKPGVLFCFYTRVSMGSLYLSIEKEAVYLSLRGRVNI